MKKIIGQIIFFELLLILGSQPFLCAGDEAKTKQTGKQIGIEGLIDLTTSGPVSYPEKFRMKAVVNYLDQGSAAEVDFGKETYYDEGSFKYYYCWTKLTFRGGAVSVELRDASTNRLVAEDKQDLALEAYFRSPTHAWSTCSPHEYPSFDRNVEFRWITLSLAISERRSLVVRPFGSYYVEVSSPDGEPIYNLYGRAHVEKENGVYILKSLDLKEALNAEVWDPGLQRMVKRWSYAPWEHYQMTREPDNRGYLWGARLIEHN